MIDNRYEPAVARIVAALRLEVPGIGVVIAPPGEQLLVADAIAVQLRSANVLEPRTVNLGVDGAVVLIGGLPTDPVRAQEFLAHLNDFRGRIISSGRATVFVLSKAQMDEFQRLAPDTYSTLLFIERVKFVADTANSDFERAREALKRWHRDRFGRLDLRGFVRAESEDVSWRVEEIYQAAQATNVLMSDGVPVGYGVEQAVVEWLEEFKTDAGVGEARIAAQSSDGDRSTTEASNPSVTPSPLSAPDWSGPVVILGHPGSGKTFLLRWLAVSAVESTLRFGVSDPIPLLISLATYAQAADPIGIYEYLKEMLLEAKQPMAHWLDEAVAARRIFFLLDGLDEVGDEAARRQMTEAVELLRHAAKGCLVVLTSRIAGYVDPLPGQHLMLAPFTDEAVRKFLSRWCELYAIDRTGESALNRESGRKEGEQLAQDVLANKEVRELARNPLLLTVLAIVHRAGVRLPDHRVELYEHATRVLVERWNRVRSLSNVRPQAPMKAADAVRLLGPIALRSVRSGSRGFISEIDLRAMLKAALSEGNLRGIATADEAILLFKNSIGLLVEQGPGLYAFLHLTLAEYFAAWELVRSAELEMLVANPTETFYAEWREVLLLAAGELGVVRADDQRLERLIARLILSANRRQGQPSPGVPSLLGGLLADDPGLSPESRRRLIGALVPKWWFSKQYGAKESLGLVVQEASRLVQERIRYGRSAEMLKDAVLQKYGTTISRPILTNLARGGAAALHGFFRFLEASDVDYGPAFLQYALTASPGKLAPFRVPLTTVRYEGSKWIAECRVSRFLDNQVRQGTVNFQLRVGLLHRRTGGNRFMRRTTTTTWRETHLLTEVSATHVVLCLSAEAPSLPLGFENATSGSLELGPVDGEVTKSHASSN
jgi:hypothetical protein